MRILILLGLFSGVGCEALKFIDVPQAGSSWFLIMEQQHNALHLGLPVSLIKRGCWCEGYGAWHKPGDECESWRCPQWREVNECVVGHTADRFLVYFIDILRLS